MVWRDGAGAGVALERNGFGQHINTHANVAGLFATGNEAGGHRL
jgi:hypothetical protein